jgi:hypothetical protein
MPRKPQVAVEPRPDGRWAVQTDGTMRADSLHGRKSDAVQRGRELAGVQASRARHQERAWQVDGKDSHGRDPRRIPG